MTTDHAISTYLIIGFFIACLGAGMSRDLNSWSFKRLANETKGNSIGFFLIVVFWLVIIITDIVYKISKRNGA